jgi:hypothetical protein
VGFVGIRTKPLNHSGGAAIEQHPSLNRFFSQLLSRLDKTQQDCDGNGSVANEKKPREDSAAQCETRRQFLIIES